MLFWLYYSLLRWNLCFCYALMALLRCDCSRHCKRVELAWEVKTQEKKKNSPKMKNFSISRREPLLFHFFLFLFSSFEILEESVMLARYTLSLFKYSAIRTTQFSGIMNSKRLFSVDSTVTVCHHRCSFHFMHNHEWDLSLYCAFH